MTISNELYFTEAENLPNDTEIFQLDNGILFYYKYSSPQRLYVKWGGRTIKAKLPEGCLGGVGVIGNDVYFIAEQKIYKASFCTCLGLTIDLERELEHELVYCGAHGSGEENKENERTVRSYFKTKMNERSHGGALLSRERNGKRYVYRMSEDPDKDGILVDAPEEQLKGARLAGLHRGKIIYSSTKCGADQEPKVCELGKNVIVIKFPLSVDSFSHSLHIEDDYSPFIYVNNQECLYTLNADTMEFLPPLTFKDVIISSIAGVHEGVVTMTGRSTEWADKGRTVLTAELPDEYKFAEDAAWAAAQCDCF